MIRILLKYVIYELCIDICFKNIYNNFILPKILDEAGIIITPYISYLFSKSSSEIDVIKEELKRLRAIERHKRIVKGHPQTVNYDSSTGTFL